MTTNTIEKYVEELSTAVTNYGYNDEYGYYCDWKNGVEPIIRTTLTTVAEERDAYWIEQNKIDCEEARRDALEEMREWVKNRQVLGHTSNFNSIGQVLSDILTHIDSLTK